MKFALSALVLTCALSVHVCAGEDSNTEPPKTGESVKPKDPKDSEMPRLPPGAKAPIDNSQTLTGTIEKGGIGGRILKKGSPDIILRTQGGRRQGGGETPKIVYLSGGAAVSAQMNALAEKSTYVRVTGTLNDNKMTVKTITQAEPPKKKIK